jgi:hypothetical protein
VVKLESFGRVFDFILGIASGIYICMYVCMYMIARCLSFRNPVPPPPTQAFQEVNTRPHLITGTFISSNTPDRTQP